MTKYLAIFYGGKEPTLHNFESSLETMDAQKLYDEFASGEPIESILVLRSGSPAFGGDDEGKLIEVGTPRVVATFYKGQHFSTHTATLDRACEIIEEWVDNLDDPKQVMELFARVTGATNVRQIGGSGSEARIGWDLP